MNVGPRPRGNALRASDPSWLGRYRLIGRLGQGGMGVVYLAETPQRALVAVKVIRLDTGADDEFRRRFRSEVSRAREVPPFCTAEVLDADPDHETPYLVVEFVDGPSLAEVVERSGPLRASNLQGVAIGVATALSAIHGAGVIHRDLKPGNVLLAPGSPKVIDFGIARALETTSYHTRTDQMVGTVAYMAPERFDSGAQIEVTPAADIFAWGAVIAYAGTGRTPFQADSPTATAMRILTQPPNLTGLDGPLRDLVAASLSKSPADRPTARDLLDHMLETGGSRRPSLRPEKPPPVVVRKTRRIVLALLALAVLAVGSVLAAHIIQSGPVDAQAGEPAPAESLQPTVRGLTKVPPGDVATIKEDLLGPEHWPAKRTASGSCLYDDDGMHVTALTAGAVHCGNTEYDFARSHQLTVRAKLTEAGSCASVWFLVDRSSGYRLTACATTWQVRWVKGSDTKPIGAFAVDAATPPGQEFRIGLEVRGTEAVVVRDATVVGAVRLTERTAVEGGFLRLGAEGGTGGRPPHRVTFRDLAVRSLE